MGQAGERTIPLHEFITDAYTTVLAKDEIVSEVLVGIPPKGSGGAYLAFKRAAPVYPTASAAVQVVLEDGVCKEAAIALGCVGLTAIRPREAEAELSGKAIDQKTIEAAAEAARVAADPQPDMRGSAEYKRTLVAALVKRAIDAAVRRARGEQVEVSHIYA
jgi:carbon-monoxide dehydrogenase medium subunit